MSLINNSLDDRQDDVEKVREVFEDLDDEEGGLKMDCNEGEDVYGSNEYDKFEELYLLDKEYGD